MDKERRVMPWAAKTYKELWDEATALFYDVWKVILSIPLTIVIVLLSVAGGFFKFVDELLRAFVPDEEGKPVKDREKGEPQ